MAKTYQTANDPADEPTEISATRARGASWGRHILWVLIISITLAALALFASYAFHTDDLAGKGGMTATPPSAAQSFDTGDQPAAANPAVR